MRRRDGESVAIYISHDGGVKPVNKVHWGFKMIMCVDGVEGGARESLEEYGRVLNAAEKEVTLYAMIRALKRMNQFIRIDMYIPSIYIYSVVEKTTYLQKWKERHYEYIKHADLWEEFSAFKEHMDIHLIYDHNHKYNEYLQSQIREKVKQGDI